MRREYRGSKHPITFGSVRCLSSDIAVVDGKWELRGVTDAGGKILPTFEGQLTVVMKRNAGWQIEAYRYTQKPAPGPDAHLVEAPRVPGNAMTGVFSLDRAITNR